MKTLTTAATALFVLCLPLLLLTGSIWWAANSLWLYTSGFERYDVAATTGLSQAELEHVAEGLIGYFNSGDNLVSITVSRDGQAFKLFTREEAIHFRDVKELFRLDFYLLLGAAAFGSIFAAVSTLRRTWRRLARGTLAGGGLTLTLMLLLGLGTLLDFNWLFLQFHFLAFTNEYWSASGYMLLLFPEGFWYDAIIYCALATGGVALLLSGIAGGYLLVGRAKRKD